MGPVAKPWEGEGRPADLRRGVMVFSALQTALVVPRLVAAVVVAWAAGGTYLALIPGAIMYGLAGWAGLKATQDQRLVMRWDPSIRAAAEQCAVLGCIADAVDATSLAYLLLWQRAHRTPPSMVVFVAIQQSFLVGMETCMLFLVWSYCRRLRAFRAVMPLEEPLLAHCEADDSQPSRKGRFTDLFTFTANPLASLWGAENCFRRLQPQCSRWQWRWERLMTSNECAAGAEEFEGRGTLWAPGVCGWDGERCEDAKVTAQGAKNQGKGAIALVDIKIVPPVEFQIHGHGSAGDGGPSNCSAEGSQHREDLSCIGEDDRVYVNIVF